MPTELKKLQSQNYTLMGFLFVLIVLVGIVVIPNFSKFADRLQYAALKHTPEKIQTIIPAKEQKVIEETAEKLSHIQLERQEIAEMLNEAQNNLKAQKVEVTKTVKSHRHRTKHRHTVKKKPIFELASRTHITEIWSVYCRITQHPHCQH